jgi:UDP-2,4-diacetamido-2,4,6-trideoxy-beta-L-altropyranose hydrolase
MKIAFRVDASRGIGTGHVMRSLTLAEGLRKGGASVAFICRAHHGGLARLIEERGFALASLLAPDRDFQPPLLPTHASWVGASWEEDACQSQQALHALAMEPDWLVVDHYGLDARWERVMRSVATRIMVIDDLADRDHDCDLLLDQNIAADPYARYERKLPRHCAMMLGPRYAMLQPAYAQLRDTTTPREGPIKRILIFFGGAEPGTLSCMALRAFINMQRRDIAADVVVSEEGLREVNRQGLANHDNVRVHSKLPSLAPVLAQVDLAIGTAGTSSWERLSLGVPALVITTAENQRAIAQALQRRGLIIYMGHADEVDLSRLERELRAHVERGADTTMSRLGYATVDGRGVERVIAAMTLDAQTALVLRKVVIEDEALLLEWANDPVTRVNSFSANSIAAEEHHAWFAARMVDPDNYLMFLVENTDGVPMGQVRFERRAGSWMINYSVAAPYRAKGLGRRVLELALMQLRSTEKSAAVVGHVRSDNVASHRIFQSLGFVAMPAASGGVEYRLTL